MKTYCKYIRCLILLVATSWTLTACNNDEHLFSPSEGEQRTIVTVCPTFLHAPYTRVIGDATGIDELIVSVYEDNNGSRGEQIFRSEYEWKQASKEGVALSLVDGSTYHLLFLAQCSKNEGYTITDEGTIEVDYSTYQEGGFSRMEELDVFYGTNTIKVKQNQEEQIILTRPLAQLNFADKITPPQSTTHKAEVTFHGIPISFNPFTGKVDTDTKDVTFTFTDFTEEPLVVDEEKYFYVASNYLFAPSTGTSEVSVTLKLLKADDSSVIKELSFTEAGERIALSQNMKTNVLGSIVQEPETWSVWDGKTPTTSPIKTDEQNRYIIDEAADVAWLSVNGESLAENSTFLQTKDIDMANKTIASVKLPAGSTYDGGGKQIINYANSLFGDATNLSVQNLTVDNVTVPQSNVTHVGVLINTLTGSATFKNVTVSNSTATTTNGAAGGFVGYIKNDNTETLAVSLTQCTATNNTVSGSMTTGVYVGLFRGYNNAETLTFSNDCNESSASVGQDAVASYYTTANAACWFTETQKTGFNKYNGWLGREEFYRGTINYGDVRYIPKWDGVTNNITPLTDGSTKLIYSAFDLANLQGKGHTAVTFKEDVDLGGDRTTNKNSFTPISSIGTLDGENHKLYNLNIFHKNWIVGFINGTSGDKTEHKNLHFVNSSVRASMTGSEAEVYVGTLCPYVNTKYTVSNITVTDGYVLGLGKVGGLIGFVTTEGTASLECNYCKIESSIIENIQGTHKDEFGIESLNLTATFNPHGEAGGLIGFLGNDATITECQVNNCNINCYGQDDQTLKVLFISYTIPGRHVNRFIGDIMTISGDAIVIKDCSATGNTFGQRKEDRHSYRSGWSTVYCDLVGRAYYLAIRGDTKGSVKIVNGTTTTTIF